MLRRFVYSGCKAIGEREYHKLMMECGKRVFPADYPGTRSASQYYQQNALDRLKNDYCPKPPSKRVNFQIIKQPAPFNPSVLFPGLDEKSVTHVQIHAFTRGVPLTNSLLYMPTAEDISSINDYFSLSKKFWEHTGQFKLLENHLRGAYLRPNLQFNVEFAKISGIEINLSNKQKQNLKELQAAEGKGTEILNKDFSIRVDVQTLQRRPIGFVTRGDYSQARGHGMGIGVIAN